MMIHVKDFEEWKARARKSLYIGLSPKHICWSTEGNSLDLGFSKNVWVEKRTQIKVPQQFLDIAQTVACHSDESKWDLLYRMLWRLTHEESKLMSIQCDDDVIKMNLMRKQVSRDIHKMTAFVRFRKIEGADFEQYMAWHIPDHFIIKRASSFFIRRFGSIHWSILTPKGSMLWDTKEIYFGEAVFDDPFQGKDSVETLWKTYYASVFNPARIKVNAMKKEMPVRYWKTLPEAELIPKLLKQAPKRVSEMKTLQATSARNFIPKNADYETLQRASRNCQGCELYKTANHCVFGEGNLDAQMMLIGEAPGDQEDMTGKPFMGPAGELLNNALTKSGIHRNDVYVTNTVKHFRFVMQNNYRLHRTPSGRHMNACRPWLESELDLIKPKVVVALGAMAARYFLGKSVFIQKERGRLITISNQQKLVITYHPAAILRMTEPEETMKNFISDLTLANQSIDSPSKTAPRTVINSPKSSFFTKL